MVGIFTGVAPLPLIMYSLISGDYAAKATSSVLISLYSTILGVLFYKNFTSPTPQPPVQGAQ